MKIKEVLRKYLISVISIFTTLCLFNLNYLSLETAAIDNKKVKVSIIVPVYKVEPWLRECMDSLVNQTLKEIEIICVDDGSPDNCGKILDEYAKKDNRVIVIHQNNQGLSAARNAGMELANGEYITFVDSDDYVELNTYEQTYKIAHAHEDDILEFGAVSFPVGLEPIKPIPNSYVEFSKTTKFEKNFISHVAVWNKLYKSTLLKNSNVKFYRNMSPAEDTTFNFMIQPYVKRFESIEKIFYHYRVRYGSIMHSGKLKNRAFCINAIPAICEEWRKAGLVKNNEVYLLSTLLKTYFWILKPIAKKDSCYSQKILDSFGADIYNPDVVKKCDTQTQKMINTFKNFSKNCPS